MVEQVLKEHASDIPILKATVTIAEWKGNIDHPYRNHPSLMLKGVPTLVLLRGATQLASLKEEELFEPENLVELEA